MNPISVICPKCQHKISIDDALTHQIEETQRKKIEAEYNTKLLEEKKDLWKRAQQEAQKKISAQSQEQLTRLKEEFEQEKAQNQRKDKQLAELKENESKLRAERRTLEEEKQNLKLQVQRQLDEEREKIREEAAKRILEEQHLTMVEKDKKIEDMQKMIEELKQKAQQGSQQLQGEVLELELENLLKLEFAIDEILPVPKGVNGADIIQKVNESSGRFCGTVIWESKRTKNWTEGWVGKLKEDMRMVGADQAVLVTSVLPQGVKSFIYRDGIYITNFENALNLAKVLRSLLAEVSLVKSSMVGKNEKMEMLYNYIAGSEFRQKVEAMLEACRTMKSTLEKEKMQMNKIWSQREKEIEKISLSTTTIHGSLTGIIGSALPEIEIFEEITLIETSYDDN